MRTAATAAGRRSSSFPTMLASALLVLSINGLLVACDLSAPGGIYPAWAPSTDLNFEVDGVLFHNKSLGLDQHFDVLGHQCSPGRPAPEEDGLVMYTPNRFWPTHARDGRSALVVSIGGPLQRFLDNMEAGWGGWKEHLLSRMSHSTTLILLLDADYGATEEQIAEHLKLAEVDCSAHAEACSKAQMVDGGYRLYSAPYSEQQPKFPILVMVGRVAFPAPWWLRRSNASEAELIEGGWITAHCKTPYIKTKSINWYAFHMFRQLRVLDYFDYWMKLDDDVRWAGRFPGDITHHLVSKRRLFFHTGFRREPDPDCIGLWRKGPSKVVELYMDTESNRCNQLLVPIAMNQPWFLNDTQVFTSEFVGGWLGFFTSPEVMLYGLLWNNFPAAIWEYRWGDQQFWKTAVGLFDDGSHIEDVSYVQHEPDEPPPLLLAQNSSHLHIKYLNILHHG